MSLDISFSSTGEKTQDNSIIKERFEVKAAPEKAPNVLEELLDRIGVGKYQYLVYLTVGIASLTDGAEMITISLLNYVIVNVEFYRDLTDVGVMGTAIFAGFFLGSAVGGSISDKYGRRKPFIFYMFLILASGLLSAIAQSFYFLVATRTVFGLTIGMIIPSGSTMVTEVLPRKRRGHNFILVSMGFSFGEIIGILIGWALEVEQ